MAAFNDIKIITQTRPCWVDGRRAMFHRWTDSARPVKPRGMEDDETADRFQLHSVHGLVEYEDGTMERVWPNTIRFADGGAFAELDWEGMEHRRDQIEYGALEAIPLSDDAPLQSQACITCAHGKENAEFCEGAEYNCDKCTVMRCICKRCEDFDRWEPKEAAHG